MIRMNSKYTVNETIGMIEDVCLAIEEHGWLCNDGHYLTDEELGKWTNEMFIEAYHLIYDR